jgi:hypothetical protein
LLTVRGSSKVALLLLAALVLLAPYARAAEEDGALDNELRGMGLEKNEAGPPPEPGKKKDADPKLRGGALEQLWERLTKTEFRLVESLELLVALLLSTLLAMSIVYHPRSYGKAATLEEAEQPKSFLLYATIGVIIGQVVVFDRRMAFVFFGLGGLFRFRTEVGPPKDTGRVILVTCIGVACGLKIFILAVISTAFAWILIFFLEGRVAHRVVVKGIEPGNLAQASEAYEEVLRENGFKVMSEKKNFLKGQVGFVFRAPGQLDREQLEVLFKDIPPKLQGAPDWEQS